MTFWDSSALLSLVLGQGATEELEVLAASGRAMAFWWGMKVEARATLSRAQRRGEIDELTAARLWTQVEALTATAHEVEPSEEVRTTAYQVVRVHELRAADALQLAAALVWADQRPAGIGFVCLDGRLRGAAAREGFDVLPR